MCELMWSNSIFILIHCGSCSECRPVKASLGCVNDAQKNLNVPGQACLYWTTEVCGFLLTISICSDIASQK